MEFQGIVKQVLPLESGVSKSGNQWSKASVIFDVTTNPQYPKLVKVSNMKKADDFAKLTPGTKVNLKVEIESREYNGRWYTEVNAWGWDILLSDQVQNVAPQQQAVQQPVAQQVAQPTAFQSAQVLYNQPYVQPMKTDDPAGAYGDGLPF